MRLGELRDPSTFAKKLRNLSKDGEKRFGSAWEYDVEADIKAYVELARKVRGSRILAWTISHAQIANSKAVVIDRTMMQSQACHRSHRLLW